MLGVNILNFPYRWEGVQTAYDMGYGVVAMNPLGGGAIPTHEKELGFLTNGDETPTEAACCTFGINRADMVCLIQG